MGGDLWILAWRIAATVAAVNRLCKYRLGVGFSSRACSGGSPSHADARLRPRADQQGALGCCGRPPAFSAVTAISCKAVTAALAYALNWLVTFLAVQWALTGWLSPWRPQIQTNQ